MGSFAFPLEMQAPEERCRPGHQREKTYGLAALDTGPNHVKQRDYPKLV
jgi:hypothetical protein